MKIILSPSKLQKPLRVPGQPVSARQYEGQTEVLAQVLLQLQESGDALTDQLGKALGTSSLQRGEGHALASFTGIVFKEIDWRSFDMPQWDYAEAHLRILSAYFGILTPLTAMYPYRLDFGARLPGINLYKHWKEEMLAHFEKDELIVNLASKEYSQMLERRHFKGHVLDVAFKEEQSDGSLRIVTVHAKQARGLMAQYFVMGLVEDMARLKDFDAAGYAFSEKLSTEFQFTFVRPYGWQQPFY